MTLFKELLTKPIPNLKLSIRTVNCLSKANIKTIGQLVEKKDVELLSYKNFGHECLAEVKILLNELEQAGSKKMDMLTDDQSVDTLHLSVRAYSCLKKAKIRTVRELIHKTDEQLLGYRNFGKKSLKDINRALEQKNLYTKNHRPPLPLTAWSHNNPKAYHSFPLFCDANHEINILDQDKDLLQSIKLDTLSFSVRAQTVFKHANMTTLYDILYTSSFILKRYRNMGNKTIKEIQEIAKVALLEIKEYIVQEGHTYAASNTISLRQWISYVQKALFEQKGIQQLLGKKSYGEAVKMRCGFYGREETLEVIGKKLGLTRERVRQILKKSFNVILWRSNPPYNLFIKDFRHKLHDSGYLFDANNTEKIKDTAAFNLLKALLGKEVIFDNNINCWYGVERINLVNEAEKFLEEKCKKEQPYTKAIINSLVEEFCLLNKVPQQSHSVVYKMFTTYIFKPTGRSKHFFFRKAGIVAICENTIKQYFPKGIYVYKDSDMTKLMELLEKEGFDFLRKKRKRAAIGCVLRGRNLCLWDWGLYIHKDQIKINEEILPKVKKWLINKLVTNNVQRISIWGAFNEYKKECVRAGITNEHALYTCMKRKYEEEFSFLKDPYIYPRKVSKAARAVDVLEKFLQQTQKAVTIDGIQKVLGLKDWQILNGLSGSDKVLQWGAKQYIHINNVKFNKMDLNVIYSNLVKELKKHEHLSVKQVYNNNYVLCQRNKVTDLRALYALLQYFYNEKLFFPRYPYVLQKQHGIKDDGFFSFNDIIGHFFTKENRVIHKHELYQYIVKKRGYNIGKLSNLCYLCEQIIRYSETSYVSLDTLEWTNRKSEALERIAKEVYNKSYHSNPGSTAAEQQIAILLQKRLTIHAPYAFLSDLLKENLPTLGSKGTIRWQLVLLIELLETIDSIRILGASRKIYIIYPNKYNVENIEDLVYYILKNEFNGKAYIDSFSKRLHDLGVLFRSSSVEDYVRKSDKIKIINNNKVSI